MRRRRVALKVAQGNEHTQPAQRAPSRRQGPPGVRLLTLGDGEGRKGTNWSERLEEPMSRMRRRLNQRTSSKQTASTPAFGAAAAALGGVATLVALATSVGSLRL